jgi:hypothetical protein
MQMRIEPVLHHLLGIGLLVAVPVWAEDRASTAPHHEGGAGHGGSLGGSECVPGLPSAGDMTALESLQVETSDIRLYEDFFERYLRIPAYLRLDHPQVDHVRAYCYRNVLIVVRQDVKSPRPTGWVQVNFVVPDLQAVQRELEDAARRLASAEARSAAYRLRLKSDVPRNHCRVDRLELSGPEGFMIGFNRVREGTCRSPSRGHGAVP